jgi:GTPase Era involved in 16S rRNA processing
MKFTYTIPILGTISAGKSTLLNGIFAKNYSQMNIRRTTMCPQFYDLPDGELQITKENYGKIVDNNSVVNKRFQSDMWDGETIQNYNVSFPPDFIKTHPDINFRIADIPGINDQQTRDIYMKWIENNFNTFDLAILVVDIHSGFNTSDEISVLNLIFKKMQEHPHVNLIILVNKCDDMVFKDGTFETDEEKDQIFDEQVIPTINKAIKEWNIEEQRVHFQKFCSRNVFIYRTIAHNKPEKIQTFLDNKHLHEMMMTEIGRNRWLKMTDEQKEKRIKEMLQELRDDKECYENNMMHCGFTLFCEKINEFIFGKQTVELYLNKSIQLFLNNEEKDLEELLDYSINISQMHFDNNAKEFLVCSIRNYIKSVIIPDLCKLKKISNFEDEETCNINECLDKCVILLIEYEDVIKEMDFMSDKSYIGVPLVKCFWEINKNMINANEMEYNRFIGSINFSSQIAERYGLTIPENLLKDFILNNIKELYGNEEFFQWLEKIINNNLEYVKMYIYAYLRDILSCKSISTMSIENKIIHLYYLNKVFKNHFNYQIYCEELLRNYTQQYQDIFLSSKKIEEYVPDVKFIEFLLKFS